MGLKHNKCPKNNIIFKFFIFIYISFFICEKYMEKYIAPKINEIDEEKYLNNLLEYYKKEYYILTIYEHYVTVDEFYNKFTDHERFEYQRFKSLFNKLFGGVNVIDYNKQYSLYLFGNESETNIKDLKKLRNKLETELLLLTSRKRINWDEESVEMFSALEDIYCYFGSAIKKRDNNYQINDDIDTKIVNNICEIINKMF